MKKVLLLGLMVLVLASTIVALSDFKGRDATVVSISSLKKAQLNQLREELQQNRLLDSSGNKYPRVTINGLSVEANSRAASIWSDGFEGTQDQWIPMSGWDWVVDPPIGQDSSQWYLEDVIVNGGAASWGASDMGSQARDWLVSPCISLPNSVTDEFGTTPLKLAPLSLSVNGQSNGCDFCVS